MRAITSRLERLEASTLPVVLGRFICLRGAEVPEATVNSFLAGLGVSLGRRDLVLQDTPKDPGSSRYVAEGEPLSLVEVIPITRPIDELLAELD